MVGIFEKSGWKLGKFLEFPTISVFWTPHLTPHYFQNATKDLKIRSIWSGLNEGEMDKCYGDGRKTNWNATEILISPHSERSGGEEGFWTSYHYMGGNYLWLQVSSHMSLLVVILPWITLSAPKTNKNTQKVKISCEARVGFRVDVLNTLTSSSSTAARFASPSFSHPGFSNLMMVVEFIEIYKHNNYTYRELKGFRWIWEVRSSHSRCLRYTATLYKISSNLGDHHNYNILFILFN